MLVRVALAALAAYVVTGLLYATGLAIAVNAFAQWPMMSPRPWNSTSVFVDWFIQSSVSWPVNIFPIRGLWEIVVPSAYFATLWLVYLAASRRSAPRHLKSTYPDNH
jgi:hypothetical protein